MLVPAWTRATSIPIAGLVLSWVDSTVAEPRPPICLSRHWRDVEASFLQWPVCVETRWPDRNHTVTPTDETISVTVSSSPVFSPSPTSQHPPSASASASAASSTSDDRQDTDADTDTDSLLDNANFLSFEDWKKQNLAKVGQSAENVGGNRRAGAAGKDDRRRPTGIQNALDSLGDDTEIELDFGGFGADAPETAKPTSWGARVSVGGEIMGDGYGREGGGGGAGGAGAAGGGDVPGRGDLEVLPHGVPRAGGTRGKDAGTTCKERFNYASFDCAATVLKTNPECKGSSSVLIENKDSYMLNECRAPNKFLILELCDDILVDTVVLANYEFFSSIFRTFRVSVADRYPAKPDQWRELGVYEARNTREVQAFAVENPLIWARYVRIEFLTHYGHEFYCPVSLIRVHGTTMLEEYKHDGDAGRGDDEVAEQAEVELQENNVQPSAAAGPVEIDSLDGSTATYSQEICVDPRVEVKNRLLGGAAAQLDICGVDDAAADVPGSGMPAEPAPSADEPTTTTTDPGAVPQVDVSSKVLPDEQRPTKPTVSIGTHPDATPSSSTTISESATQNTTSASDPKPSTKDDPATPPEATRPTGAQPPAPNPTTQESFFKSVNKRLQMLESNSTLSLLYIEEQSRILRDAFNKVEKRQLAKTSTFLEGLNVTVLNELKQFREQYDQVWKSVALEFEHQRIQYHQEIYSISAQLGVLADELVFQKRVLVIQSMMVLFCFALVLFSRGTVSSYIDFPSVQNMVSRSYSLRSASPPFESPSVSPSSYRGGGGAGSSGATGHRRNLSDDSQAASMSPTIEYSPPTPTSEGVAETETEKRVPSDELSLPEVTPLHLRSRSSPPVMKGVREEENDAGSASVSSSEEDETLGEGVGL